MFCCEPERICFLQQYLLGCPDNCIYPSFQDGPERTRESNLFPMLADVLSSLHRVPSSRLPVAGHEYISFGIPSYLPQPSSPSTLSPLRPIRKESHASLVDRRELPPLSSILRQILSSSFPPPPSIGPSPGLGVPPSLPWTLAHHHLGAEALSSEHPEAAFAAGR